MSSTIIGKRLIYEGDKALKEKNYTKAIDNYLESIKIGYFGEGESRLCTIANSLNNSEIEEKNFPDIEAILELGEKLLFAGSGNLDEDKITKSGYLLLLNFVPEEKIPRETKMYMRYLSYLKI